jgi:hypothetical protein
VIAHEPFARLLRLARRADDQAGVLKQRAAAYVTAARLCGATWSDVGAAFDVTRQAAHERFSDTNRRRRRRAVSHNADTLIDTANNEDAR